MIRGAALLALRGYRALLSPWLPVACRFTPTCSRYASEAVERHGVLRGGALAARRLLRCRPLGGGGEDPVPDVLPQRAALRACGGGPFVFRSKTARRRAKSR